MNGIYVQDAILFIATLNGLQRYTPKHTASYSYCMHWSQVPLRPVRVVTRKYATRI